MNFMNKWFAPTIGAVILATSLFFNHADAQISPAPVAYPIPVSKGGTGQTTATGAATAILPTQTGHAGQTLTTDGAGTLSWATSAGVPGGTNTDIQFNSSGTFGGSANLQWDGSFLYSPAVSITGAAGLTFSGTGARIVGDFSNATRSSRTLFQTSAANSPTVVGAIPTGSATASRFTAYDAADPNNAGIGRFYIDSVDGHVGIDSLKSGTGTMLPIALEINNAPYLTLFTTGRVFVGATPVDDGASALNVNGKLTSVDGNFSGNATLGSAASNTVTVNGSVGIGGTNSAPAAYAIEINKLMGVTNSYGISSTPTLTVDAPVGRIVGLLTRQKTAAAAITVAESIGLWVTDAVKGAGSSITSQHGIQIADLTTGTNNYGITSLVSAGANKRNLNITGTADNVLAGNTRIGGTTAPVATLDVTGSIAATTSVLSSGPTSGIGYTTGAGGTVTQATNRTTGVTCSKVSCAITLVSAAGSASWQTFTVTNTAVAATDAPRCVQQSGTDKYLISITHVGAGTFDVTFATTGGTTTEQPVFNCIVIKAVAN